MCKKEMQSDQTGLNDKLAKKIVKKETILNQNNHWHTKSLQKEVDQFMAQNVQKAWTYG